MSPSVVRFVLATFNRHGVKCILMGGQACVLHGAAEFSKDIDFVVLAEDANLDRLRSALAELEAEVIAVPPFDPKYLKEGLAVHFRSRSPSCDGFRIDVMTRLRNVAPFEELWNRRVEIETAEGPVNLLCVRDLIQAKKTQRSKDWPMIERLGEVDFLSKCEKATPDDVELWLMELRNIDFLIEAAQMFPCEANRLSGRRPCLESAIRGNVEQLRKELIDEMEAEKEADRQYWEPLKKRLAELRRKRCE